MVDHLALLGGLVGDAAATGEGCYGNAVFLEKQCNIALHHDVRIDPPQTKKQLRQSRAYDHVD
jgi:hypothetical protein